MKYIEKEANWLRIKTVFLTFGVILFIGGALNKGVVASSHHFEQQELAVLTVCPQGPPVCQFSKIQEAINAAPEQQPYPPYFSPGAEIQVAPGTYEENLIILKQVILKGAGKDRVVLRSPKGGRETEIGVLIVSNPPGSGAIMEGFTIQGSETGIKTGIVILGFATGAYIRDNRFENLLIGVDIEGSIDPGTIEGNDFIIPQSLVGCAGIAARNIARLKILRNTFAGNCAEIAIATARLNIPGGSVFQAPGERVLIEGNRGGDIYISDSAAIAIRKNTVRHIRLLGVEATVIEENVVRRGVTTGDIFSGIWVETSSDVVIQKNAVEENMQGITVIGRESSGRRTSVAILGNRVVRNGFGIVTERLEYVTVCRGNEVKENKKGDYGVVGWPDPKPSLELKQKCEGN